METKYFVGQELWISMRGKQGGSVKDRKIVIEKINGNMIWIKFKLEHGGVRGMFGTEHDLDELVNWYKERHTK